MTGIPPRILPIMNTDSKVVRCVCTSKTLCENMIRCSRCFCYSHFQCAKLRTPFVCEFCYLTAKSIFEKNVKSTITPGGHVIQDFVVKDALRNEFTMIELNEIREHCSSSPQVQHLLDNLLLYFASCLKSLDAMERISIGFASDEFSTQIQNEIEAKRNGIAILTEIVRNSAHSIRGLPMEILPSFRDSVLDSLT